jgi:phosphoenolpyruvate carboxylase
LRGHERDDEDDQRDRRRASSRRSKAVYEAARHELEANSLSRGQNTPIIRAFSYVSQIANITEDQHQMRPTRVHALAASAPREGTKAWLLASHHAAQVSDSHAQLCNSRPARDQVLSQSRKTN